LVGEKMDKDNVKEKAQVFLDEDIRVFIITTNGDYNFCDILLVTDKYIFVQHFAGHKEGLKERIFYSDIVENKFNEYREKDES